MLSLLQNIPNINADPLHYVFETYKIKHSPNTLWLEFGVAHGGTINYVSQFTSEPVYGFDSFEGLPEKWRDGFDKGAFSQGGVMPTVNKNVQLIKGWFSDTLPEFLKVHASKEIGFIHLDADLYSSTKYVLDCVKNQLAANCVLVFDELVNYPGFDGPTGELKAFYEFVTENDIEFEWIGMNGCIGMSGSQHEKVGLKIKKKKVDQ